MPPNKSKLHGLKVMPEYYQSLKHGNKTFEIRKNDRTYKVGDILMLQEYDAESEKYVNSESLFFDVTYILENNKYLQDGYCCMGIVKHLVL